MSPGRSGDSLHHTGRIDSRCERHANGQVWTAGPGGLDQISGFDLLAPGQLPAQRRHQRLGLRLRPPQLDSRALTDLEAHRPGAGIYAAEPECVGIGQGIDLAEVEQTAKGPTRV